MTCEETQQWILEFGLPEADVDEHLSDCETCQSFLALQRWLDEQLSGAYTAPPLNDHFRARIRARINTEKRGYLWDVLPALIGLGTALIMSGLCALLAPEMAGYAIGAAIVVSTSSYLCQILFTWLTEELGEG